MSKGEKLCFFMELKMSNKGKNMSNITLYHQNVRNLTNKIDELRVTMQNNCIGPHFVSHTAPLKGNRNH